MRTLQSELLKLLNQRKAWELPQYKLPIIPPGVIPHASVQYAKAHDSDPFARRRMALYLRMGYELPSDILKEAKSQLSLRDAERKAKPIPGGFEPLAKVKKALDADRAWNQYRSQQYLEKTAA